MESVRTRGTLVIGTHRSCGLGVTKEGMPADVR